MIFEVLTTTGKKRNVAYILGDESKREVVVIDMGYQPDRVLERLDDLGCRLIYMLATHGHCDHIGRPSAILRVREKTGARLVAFHTVPDLVVGDIPLHDGDLLRVGKIAIETIHTPGHTPDSVCFLVNGNRLLTGDTLYVGRCPKGNPPQMLYKSLHSRVMTLPDHVEVWPGHDLGPASSSTIGEERRSNAVVKMNREQFCRRRWKDGAWRLS